MCGIAGVLGNREEKLIERMTEALRHRGPDSRGFYKSPALDLGVRRLRIIDLVSGDQPIKNETGELTIVFNGEIYNYRELRSELRSRGHSFETQTDTEVIVHLYEEYGEESVKKLRGMFAFAITDGKELFLARDRLGIKPLYYTETNDLFLFASEIKALLECGEVRARVDEQTMADAMVLGYGFGDETYLEGIKSVRPGTWMKVKKEGDRIGTEQQEHYRMRVEPQEGVSYEESEEELGRILEEAVEKHLIGDVEAGLMLSGGVDSSLLGLLMRQSGQGRITTYAISDREENADIKQARNIAMQIGSDHREIRPSFEEFLNAIPGCVRAAEQPSSLLGLPIYLLCRQASEKHKLCLNGEGADELFGGYPQYLSSSKTIAGLRTGLERARQIGLTPAAGVVEIVDSLSAARTSDEYLTRFFPVYLQDQLVRLHLDVVDKFSMAFGIELRVPFLDNGVIDFASRLPLGFKANGELHVGKYILKKVALRLLGPVMADAVMRIKAGFPSALARYSSQFTDLCTRVSDDYVRDHQMAGYFLGDGRTAGRFSKRDVVLFDLFSLIFIEQRGTVPEGFDMVEFIEARSSRMASAAL